MTKVIDLTKPQGDELEKKPIEFVGCLQTGFSESNFDLISKPNNYAEIKRILAKGDGGHKYDLFRCKTKNGTVILMFGHFNDGIA